MSKVMTKNLVISLIYREVCTNISKKLFFSRQSGPPSGSLTDDGVIFPRCVCVCVCVWGGGGGSRPPVAPLNPHMHLHYRNNPVMIGFINNFEDGRKGVINSGEIGKYSPLTKTPCLVY